MHLKTSALLSGDLVGSAPLTTAHRPPQPPRLSTAAPQFHSYAALLLCRRANAKGPRIAAPPSAALV
ncbi:hypothetical protein BCR35DRAFT_301001 [Leucosporidium creatinivorum]|uniref:Uncharacterized protein n=1 Tax=Leucosporidium creatinivorum TaxID=106004 RepID=A0A1Y2FYM2_9BASI|nr:hypothetical protein BCR35DRAFT_301001 [Leucosporidium creatinivorum]